MDPSPGPPTVVEPTEALTVTNPIFELVNIGDDEPLLAYRINRQLYRLKDLTPLRLDPHEVRVIPWPDPFIIYSCPILIQGRRSFGVYQTRDGHLIERIPMDLNDPIRLVERMVIPTLDANNQPVPMPNLPGFDPEIAGDIYHALIEEYPLSHYPRWIQTMTPPRSQELQQRRPDEGMVFDPPVFELVTYDDEDGDHYAYRINQELHDVRNFMTLQITPRDARVIPWPRPLILYSEPILILGDNTFGVYQTRDGHLDEIIAMDYDDPINECHDMVVPIFDENRGTFLPSYVLSDFDHNIREQLHDAEFATRSLDRYPGLVESMTRRRPVERHRISSQGLALINPIFELVTHDGTNWAPYKYLINGNFYQLETLMRFPSPGSQDDIRTVPWPNHIIIYSRLLFLRGQRTFGIYQTRNGRLCEIIQIDYSDPIIGMMYMTLPEIVDGIVRPSNIEFEPFDQEINGILYRSSTERLPLNATPELLEQINLSRTELLSQGHSIVYVDEQDRERDRMGAVVSEIGEQLVQVAPGQTSAMVHNLATEPDQFEAILRGIRQTTFDLPAPTQDNHRTPPSTGEFRILGGGAPVQQVPPNLVRPENPSAAPSVSEMISAARETLASHAQQVITPTEPKTPSVSELTLETLVKQLYNLPVELPSSLPIPGIGIQGQVISYKRAVQMLEKGQIGKHSIDSLLQVWAGPPGTTNRIITLSCTNGSTYLVKARYDYESNQIFPPS